MTPKHYMFPISAYKVFMNAYVIDMTLRWQRYVQYILLVLREHADIIAIGCMILLQGHVHRAS